MSEQDAFDFVYNLPSEEDILERVKGNFVSAVEASEEFEINEHSQVAYNNIQQVKKIINGDKKKCELIRARENIGKNDAYKNYYEYVKELTNHLSANKLKYSMITIEISEIESTTLDLYPDIYHKYIDLK